MTIIVNGDELSSGWGIVAVIVLAVAIATLAFFVYDVWRATTKTSRWIDAEERRRSHRP